jgi:hypothetical protein
MNKKDQQALLSLLQSRFGNHLERHPNIRWADVQVRLEASPAKLKSLSAMEETGGEPDVVGVDKKSGEFIFFDCSAETPKGGALFCDRRYDRVFTYHNGAQSYYAVRGFRASLRV